MKYDFSNSDDLDAYCSNPTIAAAVTKKLREGATLEECTEVAKEVIAKNNKGEKWGKTINDIKGHMKWMEKRNATFEKDGDKYKIVEDNYNEYYENKKSVDLTPSEYLPTKSDCERAIEQLKKETAKTELDVTNVLNKLEVLLEENGKALHKDWKEITIGNLKTWSS